MTNEQLVAKFNPANAANLTAEDLEILRALTTDQIGVLAAKFPNQPTGRSYLRLYDDRLKPEKQIFQQSTWQNLLNVRKFSNATYLHPYDFIVSNRSLGGRSNAKKPAVVAASNRKVVDLSAQQAADELKNAIGTGTSGKVVDLTPEPKKGTGKGGKNTKGNQKAPVDKVVENSISDSSEEFDSAD